MSKYLCPQCQGQLIVRAAHLFCHQCSHTYSQDQYGITSFGRQRFWRHALAPAHMAQVITAAARQGWQLALHHHLKPHISSSLFQQALSESQADWHFMLGVRPQARVLEIGCQWGQVTTALARHYDEVHTLDANLLALQFVYWRTRQEGLSNVVLTQNDPPEWSGLPFPDHTFQLVVLNSNLAWIGAARTETSPAVYQAKAIQEIGRVLKPGGILYLSVENRLAYHNFWGHKAENGVPFVSLLPRVWANRLSRYLGHAEGYRHYTYSLTGYYRLLINNGLNIKHVYAVYPHYRQREQMFSVVLPQTSQTMSQAALSNGIGPGLHRLWQSHIWPWFAPGYGLIAERGEKYHDRVSVYSRSASGADRGRAPLRA